MFSSADVDLGQPLVTSCGTGVTACVLALAMDQLQASKVRFGFVITIRLKHSLQDSSFDFAGVSL